MFNTNAFLTGLNKSMLSDNKVLICDLEGTAYKELQVYHKLRNTMFPNIEEADNEVDN